MADSSPALISIHKAPFLAAFFILLSLSACNLSWVTDPASDYIKKKTGIEIKVERVSLGVRPFHLETEGIQLNFKKGPVSWDVKVPELLISFGWTLSWENLPWPKIYIEKVSINHPLVLIRLPEPKKMIKWVEWAKEVPAIRQIEVNDLKGRVGIGEMDFQLSPGTRISGFFSPDQGGKIEYHLKGKGLRGGWISKGIKFQARSQGSFELSDFPDQPKWKGSLTLSDGNLISRSGKFAEISGTFSFVYQNHFFELSTSAVRMNEIHWFKNDLSFQGQGAMVLSGSVQKKEIDKKGDLSSKAVLDFEGLNVDLRKGKQTIKGRADGRIQISGPVSNPFLEGKVRSVETDVDLPPVHTQGMETEILFDGQLPRLSFSTVQTKAERTDWHLKSGTLTVMNPEAHFSALLNTDNRQIHLKGLGLKTDNWGNLSGSLFFDLSKGPVPQIKAWAEGFPLPRLLRYFFPKATSPFYEDTLCQGITEWSQETADSPIVFSTSFSPAPFPFHLSGDDWQGEGITAQIDVEGKWFFREKKVQLVIDQQVSGGSLSRPPWNFRFDRYPLKARFEGTAEGKNQSGSLTGTVGLHYDPLGELMFSGEWLFGSPSRFFAGSLVIQNLPLEKGFPLLVGEPLSKDQSFWSKVSLQGKVNGRLSIMKKGKTYDLRGRILGSDLDLTIKEPSWALKGMNLDLPFHVSTLVPDRGKGLFSESGFIQVDNFEGPRLVLNRLHIPVLAGTNQFEVPDSIQIPFWGGHMVLNAFRLSDPWGDLRINAAFSMKDVDLAQLFKRQSVTGTLSGDLGPIRMDKEEARIEGSLKAQIFEGTVEGKNWVILRPFSSDRSIQGDLFFQHLNLEPITQRFSFGKMTGYVQGRVSGLTFYHNRPEQFHLSIKTQEVPGVPKSIHIKAIENISLLGTGWGALDVLRQGINRWITEYDYREIGLACDLQNDRFNVRGTIVEEGTEYLVRKPGFLGIDIINKNPDNEINFSDILERIRSIRKKPPEGT